MNKFKLFICYCCLCPFLLLQACQDCTFTSKNSTNMLLRFYRPEDSARVAVGFSSIKTSVGKDALTAVRFPAILTEASLPLHPISDTSTFFFERGTPVRRDTLTVSYDRTLSLVTPDCGYDQRIDNLKVLKSTFHNFEILKTHLTLINSTDSAHVKIYLK